MLMASTVQSQTKSQSTVTAPAQTDERPAFLAWFDRNRKLASYVAGGIAVVVIGGWLYRETEQRKITAASDALDRARGAFEAGNLPAAAAEFQRVTQTYGGTDAALQAQLELNTVRLSSGQTQLALDALKKFVDGSPPAFYASGAYLLQGSALENLKRFAEAAQAYTKGADIATEDYRKVDALLSAARAWRLAGKEKEAADALRRVVGKFPKETPGVAEAEVRLSELTKGAM
jgi:predicted negative regulator of RcsB-dependent stress response